MSTTTDHRSHSPRLTFFFCFLHHGFFRVLSKRSTFTISGWLNRPLKFVIRIANHGTSINLFLENGCPIGCCAQRWLEFLQLAILKFNRSTKLIGNDEIYLFIQTNIVYAYIMLQNVRYQLLVWARFFFFFFFYYHIDTLQLMKIEFCISRFNNLYCYNIYFNF